MRMQVLVENGESDETISSELALPIETVTGILLQEKWREILPGSDDDRAAEVKVNERWKRAIAVSSRHLSLKGIALAHESANAGDTIGFANAARGTKTFVDLARQATGMDSGTDQSASAPSINLFCFMGEARPVPEHAAKLERMKRAEQVAGDTPGGGTIPPDSGPGVVAV